MSKYIRSLLTVASEKSARLFKKAIPRGAASTKPPTAAASAGTAMAYSAVGVGLLFVASPAVLATPVLWALGFGTKGVVAGALHILGLLNVVYGRFQPKP